MTDPFNSRDIGACSLTQRGHSSIARAQCNYFGPQGSSSTHHLSQLWYKVLVCLPTTTQIWPPMWCCMFPPSPIVHIDTALQHSSPFLIPVFHFVMAGSLKVFIQWAQEWILGCKAV